MKHPSLSRLLAVFWALCLLFLGAAHALEVPRLEAPVNDQARLLSEGTRDRLNNYLQQAQQKYGVRIAALIVPSLEGESMDSLTTKTADAWGFGKQGEDKGVLLLVAVKEELVRIETGRGVEGKLTEALGERIINEEMRPFFKEGAASRGVAYGMLALVPASVVGKFTPSEKALESAARVRAAAASAGQGAAPPASAAKPAVAEAAATDAEGGVEVGAKSRKSGWKFLLSMLVVILGMTLGAYTRQHNWRRMCLAVLVLGAAWGVSMGFAPKAGMSGMLGMVAIAMFWGFFALFFLGIRTIWGAIRGKAAPAPIEAEQEAAAPAVERTDFSAPGGGQQSTWRKETPEEARARREAIASESRARHQAMLGQQQQSTWEETAGVFKEMFDEVHKAIAGVGKDSKKPSWRGIAIAGVALLVLSGTIYGFWGEQMVYLRATEREEVTARLTSVEPSSCDLVDKEVECVYTPVYTYSFQGETHTYKGSGESKNAKLSKPSFAEKEQLHYYKNDKGEWVLAKNVGFIDRLVLFGGAGGLWLIALIVFVIELKKLLGRTQGEEGK